MPPPRLTTTCERRVAVDARLVGCQVDGVVVPALHRDDRQRGAVADDDLDVLRLLGGALVAEDDRRPRVRLRLDDDVRVRDTAASGERTTIGSSSSTPGMRMSGASSSCAQAIALGRSSGRKTSPRGASPTRDGAARRTRRAHLDADDVVGAGSSRSRRERPAGCASS
jgi:hypothetical protein